VRREHAGEVGTGKLGGRNIIIVIIKKKTSSNSRRCSTRSDIVVWYYLIGLRFILSRLDFVLLLNSSKQAY
jgi:hypothetical protein